MKKKLPIGIQSFDKLISGGCAYVDKTRFIANLVNSGSVYFLSRPRRFGKSLLIDTMACAFSGRRELFSGLYLDTPESGWDWEKINPVIRISFGQRINKNPEELIEYIKEMLAEEKKKLSLVFTDSPSPAFQLKRLVEAAHEKYSAQAVVLIDEYDKPILDIIDNPPSAIQMRDELKSLYGALKDLDEHLRFVFLTGVSKFAKTGIFSGLNNLHDITISSDYSAICGYTQQELESVFTEYLVNADKDLIRDWYNGYSWYGESVYNPFDILLHFSEKHFLPFWFETGTPTFLIKLWKSSPRNPAEYDGLIAGDEVIGSFEIENLRPETLLFQAGYLTIKKTETIAGSIQYTLGFPNLEVRSALSRLLAMNASGIDNFAPVHRNISQIMENANSDALKEALKSFFASIPHDWHRKNNIAEYEGYWATVMYTLFAGMGYEIKAEDTTNRGRLDLMVKTSKNIWLFEFKVKGIDKTGDMSPLAQLKEKNYNQKYQGLLNKEGAPMPVYEIGIVFDPAGRNIEAWETGE